MGTQNIDAFAAALSGLTAQQSKLEMIGNNIANMNTIGFKASRMTFAEYLGQTIGISFTAFSQGAFQSTGNVTDLGIQGDAFFVVQGNEEQLYTRTGIFHFNGEGKLVNSNGYPVQGWMRNINSDAQGVALLGDVFLDQNMVSEAEATQNVWFSGNLNASLTPEAEVWTAQGALTVQNNGNADVSSELNSLDQVTTELVAGDTIEITGTNNAGDSVSATFTYGTDGSTVGDLLNAINSTFSGSATTELVDGRIVLTDVTVGNSETTIILEPGASNTGVFVPFGFSETTVGFTPVVTTSMVVYDAQGGAHDLTVEFEKTSTQGEWKFTVTTIGNETILEGNSGILSFDSNGQMIGFTFDDGATALRIEPGNGTPEMALFMDLDGNEGFSGLTQYDSVSTMTMREQDGRETGTLNGYTIGLDGIINGAFSNGETLELAQIAVAKFSNPSGLEVISGSLFTNSFTSGNAQIGKADELGSKIHSGVLEMSNVDLADQFTKMIEAQRAFQAASRVVSTLDEVLSETSRLKR